MIADLTGANLGTRTLHYDTTDAALYALAVGADPGNLHLVYERDLQVLPSYAATLGMWATAEAARVGQYDEAKVLHLSQTVRIHQPLPPSANLESRARVTAVYDKGSAALVHVLVETAYFAATYVMFVRDEGGWGGDRGPSAQRVQLSEPDEVVMVPTAANAAALFRLTGDPHPVHIDPDVAQRNGYRAPILHGLCTFGTVLRACIEARELDPTVVAGIEATFLAPVYPGDELELRIGTNDHGLVFASLVGETQVVTGRIITSPETQ